MISDQVNREIERVLPLADPLLVSLEAVQTAMDQGLVPQPWSQEKWKAILEEQRQATLEEQRRNEERSRKVKEESLRRYNAAGPPQVTFHVGVGA